MGMLICELRRRSPELIYFDAAYAGPYPAEFAGQHHGPGADVSRRRRHAVRRDPQEMQAALEATAELQQGRPGYRALWQHFHDVSTAALQEVFDRLGVQL